MPWVCSKMHKYVQHLRMQSQFRVYFLTIFEFWFIMEKYNLMFVTCLLSNKACPIQMLIIVNEVFVIYIVTPNVYRFSRNKNKYSKIMFSFVFHNYLFSKFAQRCTQIHYTFPKSTSYNRVSLFEKVIFTMASYICTGYLQSQIMHVQLKFDFQVWFKDIKIL